MKTFKVWIGTSPDNVLDIAIVRANNCAQAEKKALILAGDFEESAHAVRIEELSGTFIE